MGYFKIMMTPVAEAVDGSFNLTRQIMELCSNRIYEFNNGKRQFLKNRPVSSMILGLFGVSGSMQGLVHAVNYFGIYGLLTAPLVVPIGFALGIGFMAATTIGTIASASFTWALIKSGQSKLFPSYDDKLKFLKIYEAPRQTYDNPIIRKCDQKVNFKGLLPKAFQKTVEKPQTLPKISNLDLRKPVNQPINL